MQGAHLLSVGLEAPGDRPNPEGSHYLAAQRLEEVDEEVLRELVARVMQPASAKRGPSRPVRRRRGGGRGRGAESVESPTRGDANAPSHSSVDPEAGAGALNGNGAAGVLSQGMKERSDAELVIQARAGDSESYGELVRRYQRPAYSVALSVIGRHQDAEDAAQESFMVALERLEECRNPARFAGWLLAIVR